MEKVFTLTQIFENRMSTNKELQDRFSGCLLGAMIGDVVGAAVEAETPQYICKKYPYIDDILKEDLIPDFAQPWKFGCFTDDTQTIIAVAKWILNGNLDGESLLQQFAANFDEWRRYGPSMHKIITYIPHITNKNKLSTLVFPEGSFGNNAVVRIPAIALRFCKNYDKLVQVTKISSLTTHSHRLAVQGAVLHAIALMFTINTPVNTSPQRILMPLRATLDHFSTYHQSIEEYQSALQHIDRGLQNDKPTAAMREILGNDITAQRSFPIAVYAFLANPHSFRDCITAAVYLGGDTDSIACMAGALSGAFLGKKAIPQQWLDCVREKSFSIEEMQEVALEIFRKI